MHEQILNSYLNERGLVLQTAYLAKDLRESCQMEIRLIALIPLKIF